MTRASRETAWRSGARIAVGAVAAVVVLLFAVLMSIPAKAVSVVVTPTPASIVRGGSVTFNVSVAIASGERIPINGVSLKLYSDSSRATHLTGSPYLSPRAMSFVSGTPSTGRGYGYGYGYDSGEGQGYYFFRGYGYMGPGLGYGYGSGYGYGYGGGVTLVYRVTIDTSASWAVGTYYVKVEVDSGTHSFDATSSFAVTEPVFGGGGGGGIVTTTTPTTTPTTTTTTPTTTTPTTTPTTTTTTTTTTTPKPTTTTPTTTTPKPTTTTTTPTTT
ncbi:MAG: hypothetical protein HYY32_05580, partial [Chloroflexi bacterium]|nr:hypothetical protein [Chloroflexota bacterium]